MLFSETAVRRVEDLRVMRKARRLLTINANAADICFVVEEKREAIGGSLLMHALTETLYIYIECEPKLCILGGRMHKNNVAGDASSLGGPKFSRTVTTLLPTAI